MTDPLLSVIILNWNTRDLLRDCLSSLHPFSSEWEVLVVDNASTDGSVALVQNQFPAVQLITSTANCGFAAGNNLGLRASTGRYVLLLNSDTLVMPGALTALVRFMDEYPAAGAVGPRLLRPDGTPQPYAFGGDPTPVYLLWRGVVQLILHRHLHNWAAEEVHTVDWVSGACLMARREMINQVGLLDESIFMYFEDNDWCLRMRKAGWQVYFNPHTEITHIGGQSLKKNPRAQRAYDASLTYFYVKHYGHISQWLLKCLLPLYRLTSQ